MVRFSRSVKTAGGITGWQARLLKAPILIVLSVGASVLPACAQSESGDLPAMCDHAAVQAAKATGVPISVLKAISLTETGRKYQGAFRPWPWTVNMEGAGKWFGTQDEAQAYVDENFQRGARSFDVGCFQINYKWHHEAFTSIEQMFEPLANALYAAEFLKSLYAEKGSWGAAAGAYHSRNAQYADGYQARFEKIRARFSAEDGQPLPDVPISTLAAATEGVDPALRREIIRINTYPLLQGEGGGLLGSLVPEAAAAGLSLVASAGQAANLLALTDDAASVNLTAEQAAAFVATTQSPADAVLQPITKQTFVNLGAIY